MAKRIQSPSSILTFKQCPRKYFYSYILKLPTRPSIHLIRGSIVHEVLEKFFTIDLNAIDSKEFRFGFRSYVTANLLKLWKNNSTKLSKLNLTMDQLQDYLLDSQNMLNTFVENFSTRLDEKIKETDDLPKAFKLLTPSVEESIQSAELKVRGFIDAIHTEGDEITIIDYKTSKKDDLTPEYRLQLGIYALLYKLKYGIVPAKVGINFLKFGEKIIDVDDSLLEHAKKEILDVHSKTDSEDIADYCKNESGLCKWHSGQCDFYDECKKN
jgi:RecB family exonuclease